MTSVEVTQIKTSRLTHGLRTCGDNDGLPMLLIHGGFASSRWWEPFMHVLPPEVRVAACDLRGCGGSDRPASGYSIPEQAQDIAAVVASLGWDEFDLVGHAAGGAIAVELTLSQAVGIRTLSLIDSAPVEGVYTPVEGLMLFEQMRTDRTLLRNALQLLMPTYAPAQRDDDPFFTQLVDDAATMAPAAFTEFAVALNRWNRFAEARQLALPTLLVWGDQDIVVEREAITRTLVAIPGASRLEIVRGVGHSPMIEAPVALAELLIDFITDEFEDYDEARRMAYEDEADADQTSNI
jgi:branched-chain amino acid transport system permease protein